MSSFVSDSLIIDRDRTETDLAGKGENAVSTRPEHLYVIWQEAYKPMRFYPMRFSDTVYEAVFLANCRQRRTGTGRKKKDS